MSEASPESKSPIQISSVITVSSEALYVVRDEWYPGWTVTVNGHPAELVRADMVFRE